MKIYCEHGGLTSELRKLQLAGRVRLVLFPYDLGSNSRQISRTAIPSAAQYRDLNLPYSELKCAYDDFKGTEMLPRIIEIIGVNNRRDALHVDSAFKSGCQVFVTRDTDILKHSMRLQQLLGIRVINPDKDHKVLLDLLAESEAV